MKKYIFMFVAVVLFACNNNPKTNDSTTSDTTHLADTTKPSSDSKQMQQDSSYQFTDVAALPKTIDTTSKKNLAAEMRPVMFINQNANMNLSRWYYVGSNWQNQNCPVAQTCASPDLNVCRQDPNARRQIGYVPCGVTFTIYAVFFDRRIGRERNMKIENVSCDCAKPAYNVFLGPEH